MPLDGAKIIEKWGNVELGKTKVTQIHLSNRNEFEFENQRMSRELWREIKDNKATYACDQRIRLSYDDMF